MGQETEPRPALLPVEHPLNYTRNSVLLLPKSTEEQITYLYNRTLIHDLLNTYGYTLDTVIVTPSAVENWIDLFTEDCSLTYPFGTHRGREGLGEWCLGAETRFKRMLHMSSNFVIQFESETVAHGRSTLIATCGLRERELGQCIFEGGYYYWSFRKGPGDSRWRISYLFFDVNWTSGDSLGLNEATEK